MILLGASLPGAVNRRLPVLSSHASLKRCTLPFAKFSRKDWYCGKVLVATKVPEQTFQFKVFFFFFVKSSVYL